MELNEYQRQAMRTKGDEKEPLFIAALGLSGETGEVNDHIKKYLGHGHKLDKEYITKELGDILWYIAYMADTLDISLEDIAKANIEKLAKRYPDGFSKERSLNRKD